MDLIESTPEFDTQDRMRVSLRRAGWTASDMADYLGVSRSAVSEWLNGKAEPKLGMLRAWAMGTGVAFEWLCAARDSNPEPADYWLRRRRALRARRGLHRFPPEGCTPVAPVTLVQGRVA